MCTANAATSISCTNFSRHDTQRSSTAVRASHRPQPPLQRDIDVVMQRASATNSLDSSPELAILLPSRCRPELEFVSMHFHPRTFGVDQLISAQRFSDRQEQARDIAAEARDFFYDARAKISVFLLRH